MTNGEAIELAGKIVDGMEQKYGNAPYGDRDRNIDTIVADSREWRYYIAASIYAYHTEGIDPGFLNEGGA